ncbi:MAG: hypothetical protein Kow002_00780 [Anaerolineales bacterium]
MKRQIGELLKINLVLFFLNAAVWLVLAGVGFMQAVETAVVLRRLCSGLMLANVLVMLWLGFQIMKGSREIFFFAMLYLALNAALSVSDRFGLRDTLILLLNLCLLGMILVAARRK